MWALSKLQYKPPMSWTSRALSFCQHKLSNFEAQVTAFIDQSMLVRVKGFCFVWGS